ncbi:MAG: GIY-YIG nuclease family protein, partial [Rhodospirillaceae bacterium]|nr:GIY-YIG nuclease family protein [Rhodospirillaceae bacterium]
MPQSPLKPDKSWPSSRGAYVILIRLDAPATVNVERLGHPVLPAGVYGYCGSARGPGGLGARLARHHRPTKPRHWHVDHLTTVGEIIHAVALPSGDECSCVAALMTIPRVVQPVSGFGSSDCRHCRSHLVAFPINWSISKLTTSVNLAISVEQT